MNNQQFQEFGSFSQSNFLELQPAANVQQQRKEPIVQPKQLTLKDQQGRDLIDVLNQPSEQQMLTLKQLKVLQGKVFRVMKLAESSIGYNPRMMGVRPNGMLVYYSKIVDDVETGKIDRVLIPPKAGVFIEQVQHLVFEYNPDKNKTNIQLSFQKNRMYTFDRNPNGIISFPKTIKEVSWTFIIEGRLEEEKKPAITAEKARTEIQEQKQVNENASKAIMEKLQRDQEDKARSLQELQKEKREKEKLQLQEKQNIKQQEEEDYIRRKEELVRQDDNRKKSNNLAQIRGEKKAKIQSAWEFRMYLIIDELNKQKVLDQDFMLKSGLKMFQLIGAFRENCVLTVKELIEDLAVQESHKKFIQIDTKDIRYSLKESEEMIYFVNNLIIRISHTELIKNLDPKKSTLKQSSTNDLLKALNMTTFYDSRKSQLINHEFRSYEIMADVLMMNRQNSKGSIQVPLTCSVEYRGFKCLCMADIPIQDNSLVVGAMNNGAYITHTPLVKDFIQISKLLNLKAYKLPVNRGLTDIYLSVFCEVFRAKPEMWDEVRRLIDQNSELWEELHTVLKKQKDKLDRLDGGKLSQFYDADLDSEIQNRFKDHFYLVKLGGIFPVQVDVNKQSYNYYSNRLRPELVTEHSPVPLSTGAFLSPLTSTEQDQDDIAVAQVGQMLLNEVIPKMVAALDRLSIVPVDSPTITRIFHQNGVNIRFLGRLAKLTLVYKKLRKSQLNYLVPHLKEISLIEIIARTLKKILNHHWVEFASNHFREENQDLFQDTMKLSTNYMGQFMEKGEHQVNLTQRIESSSAEIAIDFLNLIFGSGQDTVQFWNDIVRPQALSNYCYDIGKFPIEVTNGGLMHSILYHCRIKITYTNSIQFFKVKSPFQINQFVQLLPHSKAYSYKSSYIRVLADKFQEFRTNISSLDLALKSLNLKVTIEKALRNQDNQPHAPLPEAILFADMGEIHLQRAAVLNESARHNPAVKELQELELDQAIAKAKISIEMIPPLHAESVKPLCVLLKAYFRKPQNQDMALEYFDQAINILEFHVGPYHPLHASIYSIMSQCYLQKKKYQDCLVLLKSALICCTRILGNNHTMTAEVYMDMANVYIQMNDRVEAIKVVEKALVINEAERGILSPECGKLNLQLSGWYSEIQKFDSALEYAQTAMKIFEPHDKTYSQDLLEATYNCAKSCDSLGDNIGILRFSEKLYSILEKFQMDKDNYYEFAIKSVMITEIDETESDLKNFLYKLMIVLSSQPAELQMERVDWNDPINTKSFSEQQVAPQLMKVTGLASIKNYRFQPPIQVLEEKKQIIDKIILSLRVSKSLSHYFKSMFYCFKGRLNEVMYNKNIYNQMEKFLKDLKDPVFIEYVEIYSSLLELYGEDLFYQRLKMTYKFK